MKSLIEFDLYINIVLKLHSFPRIAPLFIMLSIQHRNIKYQFFVFCMTQPRIEPLLKYNRRNQWILVERKPKLKLYFIFYLFMHFFVSFVSNFFYLILVKKKIPMYKIYSNSNNSLVWTLWKLSSCFLRFCNIIK